MGGVGRFGELYFVFAERPTNVSIRLQFKNRMIGQVACDMLLLLCDHSEFLLEHYADIPPAIIQVPLPRPIVRWCDFFRSLL